MADLDGCKRHARECVAELRPGRVLGVVMTKSTFVGTLMSNESSGRNTLLSTFVSSGSKKSTMVSSACVMSSRR